MLVFNFIPPSKISDDEIITYSSASKSEGTSGHRSVFVFPQSQAGLFIKSAKSVRLL